MEVTHRGTGDRRGRQGCGFEPTKLHSCDGRATEQDHCKSTEQVPQKYRMRKLKARSRRGEPAEFKWQPGCLQKGGRSLQIHRRGELGKGSTGAWQVGK